MDTQANKISEFAPGKSNGLINLLWECAIAVLFFYVFFYQNAVGSISGGVIILCALVIALGAGKWILRNRYTLKINFMFFLSLFVLLSVFISYFTSTSPKLTQDVSLRMVEYLLAALALYSFLIWNPGRLHRVIFYLWLSLVALTVYVLFNGEEVEASGAIGVESLNINLLSSFLLLQFFCSFLLWRRTKNKIMKLVCLLTSAVAFFVQIQSASRRGFIIICVFVLAVLFWGVLAYNAKKRSLSSQIFSALLILALALGAYFLATYVMEQTVLGQRLAGAFTSGDDARDYYQRVALEQFRAHPVFGIGLNGVAGILGVYSHSLYYEVLACTGLVGALILFACLLCLGYQLLRRCRLTADRNPDDVFLFRCSFLFWACTMASGLAVVMIYDFYFYISLALLAACVSISAPPKKVKKEA